MDTGYDDSSIKALLNAQGLDMNLLYHKYKSVKTEEHQHCQTDSQENESTSIGNVTDSSKLDKYRICHSCNGAGSRKDIYNYIVREFTCEKCDGDGILPKES
jgi:DnaJ-class molecular chaperone